MKRILVVDYDSDILELIKNRLQANNYEVISASKAMDGIKKAQQQQPDLIVMDIMMPGYTGADAVKVLKSDKATAHIPVIFLTSVVSHLSPGGESLGINVDGKFYTSIAKPFRPDKLLFEINRVISGRGTQSGGLVWQSPQT